MSHNSSNDIDFYHLESNCEEESMCIWVWVWFGDGYYDTACNNYFHSYEGKLRPEFKYCPYCGLEIKEEVEVETAKATAGDTEDD